MSGIDEWIESLGAKLKVAPSGTGKTAANKKGALIRHCLRTDYRSFFRSAAQAPLDER
jgi:hypothetical protein